MTPATSDNAQLSGHSPVLLTESIDALNIRAGGVYLDGTFGGGGHSRAILAAGGESTRLVALDADLDAIQRARDFRAALDAPERITILHANLRDLASELDRVGVGALDGALLDLGLSSFQLDTPERGFSFRFDAPLDMRFDQTFGERAADLLNTLPEQEIADLLFTYGEERKSRRIAAAIINAREERVEWTTTTLAALVERTIGRKPGVGIHPATRTFQALRIAVNHELDALAAALDDAVDRLTPGGRLVVIAFHSLEDRIVKRFIAEQARSCICPPEQPVCTCSVTPRLRRIGLPIRPAALETGMNARSRSSIMRTAERL
ncbi:MAG: 16S rRNA (cytosine(1402)-N(4))-methyltransferase RsmH [Chloroflexia bacterium]|nr:16S rRNA (cytosine(1402)-N(4))-methyltransferase RsmH [Chloroflexia bacterium]